MGQLITINPIWIAMIVVVVVLYGLSWIIRLNKGIDPTQKKNVANVEQPTSVVETATPVVVEQDNAELVAVIAAAIAAYGYTAAQITAIRPIGGRAWAQAARLEVVNTRNQMF